MCHNTVSQGPDPLAVILPATILNMDASPEGVPNEHRTSEVDERWIVHHLRAASSEEAFEHGPFLDHEDRNVKEFCARREFLFYH